MAHFDIPVNLPHAATLARRIQARLIGGGALENPDAVPLLTHIEKIQELLDPYYGGEDPLEAEGMRVVTEIAPIARLMVDEIERLAIGEDRLGQWVRNFFECLGLGEEGADISLRAGENPNSLMRPG